MRNPLTLNEVLAARVNERPQAIAYTFLMDGEREEVSLSYEALYARARGIADVLEAELQAGDRVLLLFLPGMDYVVAFFGCLLARMMAVPAYPPDPMRLAKTLPRLQRMIADSQATAVLTTEFIQGMASSLFEHAPDLEKLKWIASDTVPSSSSSGLHAATPETVAFLQYTSGSTANPRGVLVSHANVIANSKMSQATFGSGSWDRSLCWLPPYHDLGLIGGILHPLCADFESAVLMSPMDFLQRPLRWLEALTRYRTTFSSAPNFAYELCARRVSPEQLATLDLHSWRAALNGAEPVRRDVLDRFASTFAPCGFRSAAFSPCYGLAESTLAVSGVLPGTGVIAQAVDRLELGQGRVRPPSRPEQSALLVSCGEPGPGLTVEIVDPERGEPSSPGQVGEIWVSGPSVAGGYWQRPEESAQTFGAVLPGRGSETFLRTGDLGFLSHGQLYITGRLKDLLIVRGQNHYPQDIEQTVESLEPSWPELRLGCSAAAALPGADGEERLLIVQEVERRMTLDRRQREGAALLTGASPRSGKDRRRRPFAYKKRREGTPNFQPQALVDAICQAVLQRHGLSVHAVALVPSGSLPKTSSGKVQRHACRLAYESSFSQWDRRPYEIWRSSAPQPLTGKSQREIADWLTRTLAERLRVDPATLRQEEPFDAYGLDSGAAVELSGTLAAWLGSKVSPSALWDYPSIDKLAAALSAKGPAPVNPVSLPSAREDIAVIGLACRVPGADSPEALWELLSSGKDAIKDVPRDRQGLRDTARWGGFINDVDLFSPRVFGISPREAVQMDPQQRLVLEMAWEALERANIAPDSLAGTRTGVFVGISGSDYLLLQAKGSPEALDAYTGTGNAHSIAANRLSYVLDLKGPSMAVDTACSSSLVAIHLACQSLRQKESSLAIVAGVNLLLSSEPSVVFSRARMLSADGRCKSFDAAADGYVRSEGCAAVVLKPLAEALADGDSVLAIIRGSAVNQDGRSNGLTAPNGVAQQEVIREALSRAGVSSRDVAYVEAHGTGTPLGDPIEAEALGAVLGAGRDAEPCLVGAVKSNLGHLEAAAGITGLLKVVLALQHGEIPANLHLRTLNPLIQAKALGLDFPAQKRPWPSRSASRIAGVSSFGFGGTNAHVVLEAGPARKPSLAAPLEGKAQLMTLSAHSPAALEKSVQRLKQHLIAHPAFDLEKLSRSLGAGRASLPERWAWVSRSKEQLMEQLAAPSKDTWIRGSGAQRPRLAFLFTGQGERYGERSVQLHAAEPVFAEALERCIAQLDRHLPSPLMPVLRGQGALDRTEWAQPALFAFEYALCALWRSWGVVPDAVMGHSAGEWVAACIAGAVSLEDAARLISVRGRLMGALPGGGAMASVGVSEQRLRPLLRMHQGQLTVAAVNAPDRVVLSGEAGALDRVLTELRREGVACEPLAVSHAFHSHLIEPMLSVFEAELRTVHFRKPELPWVSSLTGQAMGAEPLQPDYWLKQAREPVRFAEGIQALTSGGADLFLEIGPAPSLTRFALRSLPRERATHCIASLGTGELRTSLLQAAARLFTSGVPLSWQGLLGKGPRMLLPTSLFEKERYWLAAPVESKAEAVLAPLVKVLDRQAVRLFALFGLERYGPFIDELEAVSGVVVRQTLRQLGWSPRVGDEVDAFALASSLGIAPRHTRLFCRLLEMLEEDQHLEKRAPNQWRCVEILVEEDAQQRLRDLEERFPACEPELALFSACATRLADVLRGTCNPLSLLFPDGSLARTEALYEESPSSRFYNSLVQSSVSTLVESAGRPLRILEVGGGTGGTSAYVLPKLPGDRVEYLFTDVSPLFLNQAEKKFGRFPFVRYGLLDLERAPLEQGYTPHSFDIILAANVLHATMDLQRTVQNLRGLLAPEGSLVLLEGSHRQRGLDLIFGLTEGWWKFEDLSRRDYPLVSADAWRALLLEEQFTEVVVVPRAELFGRVPEQAVLVARGPRLAEFVPPPKPFPAAIQTATVSKEGIRQKLVRELSRALRVDPAKLSPELNFLDLGLDSLMAIEILSALKQELGVSLSPAVLFEHPSLRQLTDVLFQAQGGMPEQETVSEQKPVPLEDAEALRYQLTWVEKPHPGVDRSAEGTWLLFAEAELAHSLREALEEKGATCFTVERGSTEEIREAFRVARASAVPLRGVLFAWGEEKAPTLSSVEPALEKLCTSFLSVLRSLVEGGTARLWVLTPTTAIVPAVLWGLGRVAAIEHAPHWGGLIDFSPALESEALLRELTAEGGEDAVSLRAGRRYVARLAPVPTGEPLPALRCREDGAYLITGGLGGLGGEVAQWLVAKGARHLVLLGRTSNPKLEFLRSLETQGARVTLVSADVGDVPKMRELFSRFGAELPPLRGIIHAAAAVTPRALLSLNASELKEILRSKAVGGFVLDQLSQDSALDFFVCFSSVVALWGSLGLGHYAGANSFLDALAHRRHQQGKPALSVNWGIWDDVGMTAQPASQRLLTRMGLKPLLPRDALSSLEKSLASGVPQQAIASMDWPTFKQQFEAKAPRRRLLEQIVPEEWSRLSFAQERLWFLDQLAPGTPLYNIATALRIEGPLRLDVLEQCLRTLVGRHEALRTTFSTVEGEPRAKVSASAPLSFRRVDLDEGSLESRMREEASAPFDLGVGPLLRGVAYVLAPHQHVCQFTVHHIVADGWSLGILARELWTLYLAASQGKAVTLPALPLRYADYVESRNSESAAQTMAMQLDYWKHRLQGAPERLDLPTDFPRPSVRSSKGALHSFHLSPALTQQLKERARQEGITLFNLLVCGYQTLLFRYSGQQDICIGTPVAGREERELHGLMGLFANTLVLRSDFSEDPTFRELWSQLKTTILEALSNQDLPFERVVAAMHPTRSLAFTPLFQAALVHNPRLDSQTLPGLKVERLEPDPGISKFDLHLTTTEEGEGLRCTLEYSTDLFEASTAARMMRHLVALWERMVDAPDERASSAAMLEPQERTAALNACNHALTSFPVAPLQQLFEAQVARSPNAVAMTHEGATLSYRELNERANQLAWHLKSLGVQAETRVALCVERGLDFAIGVFGILKAGGAYVPLDPAYPQERLALMMEDAGAPVLVTQQTQRSHLPASAAQVLLLDEVKNQPRENPPCTTVPDHLAYVIYTSGSTGRPKGNLITHASVARLFSATDPWFGFGAADVWSLFHSSAFDLSVWELFGALLHGGKLVGVSSQVSRNPAAFRQLLAEEGVTVLTQTPSAFLPLSEADANSQGPALSLRLIVFAGEALNLSSLQPWVARYGDAKPELINMYGITETTVHVTYRRVLTEDIEQGKGSMIGLPIPDLQIYLLDKALEPVPPGVAGEIFVGGPGLAQGYLGRPELTRERFIPHPFSSMPGAKLYRSGDLARWSHGELEYLGRMDDQVKLRGFRVELGEVKAALLSDPHVQDAAVVLRSEGGNLKLCAYVVARGEAPSVRQLSARLSTMLPEYMVPSAFVLLKALPLTANGKLDRRALPAPDRSAALETVHVPPRDLHELRLQEIWSRVLGLSHVGIKDSFFDLGGHSLLAIKMLSQVEAAFGVRPPLQALFENPTLEHMAKTLRSQQREENALLVQLQKGTSLPPLYLVHPSGGDVFCYAALARSMGTEQPVFAFRAPGLAAGTSPEPDVQVLARRYIEALRVVQPQGPYALAGWSFGGLVAFEMARQLEGEGEVLSLVALVDTLPPGEGPKGVTAESDKLLSALWLRDIAATLGTELPPEGDPLWEKDFEEQLAALPFEASDRPALQRMAAVFQASFEGAARYAPGPYRGPLTVFAAETGALGGTHGSAQAWAPFAEQGAHVLELEGDHYSLLKPPQVQRLAESLRRVLDGRTP